MSIIATKTVYVSDAIISTGPESQGTCQNAKMIFIGAFLDNDETLFSIQFFGFCLF